MVERAAVTIKGKPVHARDRGSHEGPQGVGGIGAGVGGADTELGATHGQCRSFSRMAKMSRVSRSWACSASAVAS